MTRVISLNSTTKDRRLTTGNMASETADASSDHQAAKSPPMTHRNLGAPGTRFYALAVQSWGTSGQQIGMDAAYAREITL
jgi:hypothetical protein